MAEGAQRAERRHTAEDSPGIPGAAPIRQTEPPGCGWGGMEGCARALGEELDAHKEWQVSQSHLRCVHHLTIGAMLAPWHNRNTGAALTPCPGGLNS